MPLQSNVTTYDIFYPIFDFEAFDCFVEITLTKFKHFPHLTEVGARKRQPFFLQVIFFGTSIRS